MIKIEINQKTSKKFNEGWLANIAKKVLKWLGVKNADISLAVVGDGEMKKLNRQYRGKNKTTDVLSFNYRSRKTPIEKILKNAEIFGEIVVSYPQAARQARECGHSVNDEVKMLLVHGILHLCGYDHEAGKVQAKKMFGLQEKIIEKLTKG